MKSYYGFILLLIFLAGCSANNSLTSFNQRKYTKGFFNNTPAEKPVVESNKTDNRITKKAISKNENEIELQPVTTVEEVKKSILSYSYVSIKSKSELSKTIEESLSSVSGIVTASDKQDSTKSKNAPASTWLFSAAAVCATFAILLSSNPAIVAGVIALGVFAAILLVVGIISAVNEKEIKDSSLGKKEPDNRGVRGFVLSLIALPLVIVFGFLLFFASEFGLSIFFLVLFVLVLVFAIGAFITSAKGTNEQTDKHPGLGAAGVFISVLNIIIAILIISSLIKYGIL